MKFYHGTTLSNWEITKKQGYLLNDRGRKLEPCTYLAVDKEEAKHYGQVTLAVDYEPGSGKDNYQDGCWQVRVYSKIPLEDVVKL